MAVATILVVDDDPDFVEIMRMILLSQHYDVVTASNSADALQQILTYKPDLMILDIMMSTMLDGYHLSQSLAKDPDLQYLPTIMVSSIADTPHAGLFPLEDPLHADAWLSKPVSPHDLLSKIQELLA